MTCFMQPNITIRRRVMVSTSGLLIVFLIISFLTPYHAIFAGLLLGTLVSLYNFLYLGWKLRQVLTSIQTDGRMRRTGMINRFLVVIAAMLIAIKSPSTFDVRTVILGLPLCYILSIISYFLTPREQRG